MRRKLVAGNWKMNGTSAALDQVEKLKSDHTNPSIDIVLCPPATLLHKMMHSIGNAPIFAGGQDCHADVSGAHTGDVSAEMLADCGASYVIVGHSERRTDHRETNDQVRIKTKAAWRANLKAIVCIGETLEQREAANTLDIIVGQLAGSIPDNATGENLVVAYEPVWAIGTGKVPGLDDIGEVHDLIRTRLERRFGSGVGRSVRLLYGGSVKASNAGDIFDVSNVDGALVGGASLKADDFSPIINALQEAN
ncbi:triose-phosphate isomerase [Parasulfitobacter algicola]|uniref:Triosephosphate isomerase n=1 Tax=Parasulfitobacter algicola TaxID=2614809 RepID=A0ABX2IPE7_9RHOB|nr:triose-phosphate isomerase [Sulfitobacter algicola]NSX54764.1 triose-phosphate isomerase [Sulfitobacter algicola]